MLKEYALGISTCLSVITVELFAFSYGVMYQRNIDKVYEKRLPITSYLIHRILFNPVAQWTNAQIKMLIE